jgi:hypothetical protein
MMARLSVRNNGSPLIAYSTPGPADGHAMSQLVVANLIPSVRPALPAATKRYNFTNAGKLVERMTGENRARELMHNVTYWSTFLRGRKREREREREREIIARCIERSGQSFSRTRGIRKYLYGKRYPFILPDAARTATLRAAR